jgi:hypothetical protein
MDSAFERAIAAVIRVGGGRGFVVQGGLDHLIVTAGHCLPRLPRCFSADRSEVRTYRSLLGPLKRRTRTVWGECLFVNPIADIAVIGPPDDQALPAEWEKYGELVDNTAPLPVSECPANGRAWLISLDLRCFECRVERFNNGPLFISDAASEIVGGMSGSPILADEGSAIGVLCTGGSSGGDPMTEGGPDPVLTRDLPTWILRDGLEGVVHT